MSAKPLKKIKVSKKADKKTTKPRIKKDAKVDVVKVPKKPVNYLNNKDLLAEVIKSKSQNKMTDKLAHMLTLLTTRYASKGNFASYSYLDDMRSYAMLMLCKTWNSFNIEKSENPFAFFTQCIKNSFRQYLNSEKKQRDIRDQLLVDAGMSPSLRFQMDHQGEIGGFEDESQEDFFTYKDPFEEFQ